MDQEMSDITHPDLSALLATFAPVTLAQMADVALLDRSEAKYVMPERMLAPVLSRMNESYRVLVAAGLPMSRYRTLYFDTADLTLYQRHHAGARDRYKVPAREYVDSHAAFFEVKHKTKQWRTVKSRIPMPRIETELNSRTVDFLADTFPYAAGDLDPVLWNNYTRITLVSNTRPERVTLDLDLGFTHEGERAALPGIVVAEVKYSGSLHGSDFARLMREFHVRSTSFSKYCMGVTLLYPDVKQNRFKAKHRLADRLVQGAHYGIH